MFIGDPAGLSDEAMRRRPEAMLSLALKYGTTDFMAPHPRQMRGDARLKIPGLTWVYGDSVGNIKRLVELNVKALDNAFPDSAKVTFDERTGSFVNTDTGKVIGLQFLGARLARSRSAGASEAGAALAGRKTVARGAVWRALLRQSREATGGADGGRNGLLAGLAGIAAQSGSATKGLFSRRVKPAFSRGAQVQANGHVQQIVDLIRSRWTNAPKVVVAFDMDDPAIPERVRQEDQRQRSGGATGTPEGFYYKGTVYLMSSKLATNRDVVRVLFHEALGHYGLRGVFGKELKPLLQQIATMRKAQIDAKMKEYGLRGVSSVDRLIAAEEILAEMAQDSPQIGFVRRAIATIKAWLRKHIPGFMGMKMTDDELVTRFILPARNFVVNGGNGNIEARGAAFSRPVVQGFDFDRPWRDLILKNKFSDYDTPAEISVTRHDDHVPGTGQTYSAPKEFVFGVQNDSGWVSLHVEEMDGPYSGDKVLTSALEAVYPKGTGIATKLYLAALNVAQKTNRGWLSEGIRSDNSLGIYERLEKAGIPFAQVGRKSYISAADLNGVDLAAVASRLSGGPNGGPGGGVRFNRNSDSTQGNTVKRNQTETPQFKQWFGDWESARKSATLNGPTVASVSTSDVPSGGYKVIENWAAELFAKQGGVARRDGFGEVLLDYRAAKTSMAHSGANLYKKAAFAAVKDVIERGALVLEKSDAQEDSFYFSAPVDIDGRTNIETVLVHRDPNTQRMYLHSVATKENLLNQRVSSADAEASGRSGSTDSGEVRSVIQSLLTFKASGVSKVVDADGKPLVVYHGIGSDFSKFSRTHLGSGPAEYKATGTTKDSRTAGRGKAPGRRGGSRKPCRLHPVTQWRAVQHELHRWAGVAGGRLAWLL